MSDNLGMDEVNENLKKIEEMYARDSFGRRMKALFTGLKAPRQSREYKTAVIELQRLSAPVAAFLLPLMLVGMMGLMSNGSSVDDRIIETQMMEAEEVKNLDEPDDVKPPDDFQPDDMDVDLPVIEGMSIQAAVDIPGPVSSQPVSSQPQSFDTAMTVKSPVILKNIYGTTRTTGTRGAQLGKFGGDKVTEDAVVRSLRWLKSKQQKDGSWGGQKIAMTGLGILTFLAHGEKPGDPDSVEFGDTVQKALEFLINNQNPDGRFKGMDGNQYAHPIATYALCEAYGMTLNPNVKAAAEKALVPIIKGQHPTGGWTYKMDPGPEKTAEHGEAGKYRDDTSYMGWCAQALKAAKLSNIHADGLDKAMKLSIKGFKANAHKDGGFGYTSPGRGGLTSVGALCMQLLGASNEPEVKKSLDLIGTWVPTFSSMTALESLMNQNTKLEDAKKLAIAKVPDNEKMFYNASAQYYFYYATQCKFHEGGKQWDNWNKAMKPSYVKAQIIEKDAYTDTKGKKQDAGYWKNVDAHSDRPVMDTCLAALQLMVYYRYLPTTDTEKAVRAEAELTATSTDTDDIKVDIGNL